MMAQLTVHFEESMIIKNVFAASVANLAPSYGQVPCRGDLVFFRAQNS